MKADNFVLEEYYRRIGYSGDTNSELELVRDVMRCHLCSIAFENIDVQLGKAISIEPRDIVEKIIHRQRGGYCYEHNGLFALFLEKMGIHYQFLGCRPMFYPALRPRTHVALLVDLEHGKWLCDLGFGALGVSSPMNIADTDHVIQQGIEQFQLNIDDHEVYVLKALNDGEWQRQYGFNLSRFEWVDFLPANYFNYTHPDSLFVQKLLMIIKNEHGRCVLLDRQFKQVTQSGVEERELGRDELAHILASVFYVPEPEIEQVIKLG